MEAAQVALTSPTTTTQSGFHAFTTFSKAAMVRPTCSAWVPEPTPRLCAGFGIASSSKKTADMFGS